MIALSYVVNKIGLLDVAQDIEDMNVPTFRLHALKGDLKGFWAVTVRANWRIIFRFADGKAFDVDLSIITERGEAPCR